METYRNQTFECFYDQETQEIFENIEFDKCVFDNCRISQTNNPFYRSTVRHVKLTNCKTIHSDTGIAIIEDVTVENLTVAQILQIYGSVYKHVTLKGKIGNIMLCDFLPSNICDEEEQEAVRCENREYYDDVDWALDISQAEFIDCDIRGVPSDLIRRDPETQMILRREKAELINWGKLPLKSRLYQVTADNLLYYGYDDTLLIAPKRARDFAELMHDLKILKEEGWVE